MIGFHDYEQLTSKVGTFTRTKLIYGNKHEYDLEGLIVVEKCSECEKEKAYIHFEDNSKKDIPLWKAKQMLGFL